MVEPPPHLLGLQPIPRHRGWHVPQLWGLRLEVDATEVDHRVGALLPLWLVPGIMQVCKQGRANLRPSSLHRPLEDAESHNGVGCHLRQLHAIEAQDPCHKLNGRDPEARAKEYDEDHDLVLSWLGCHLRPEGPHNTEFVYLPLLCH